MTSLSAAVQQISSVLSEGVSKFTLFVVSCKEKQAKPTPALTNAVDVISGHSQQLAGLANTLAQGYSDYPSIQSKIQSEAAGLSSAEKNLCSTCESLNRSSGASDISNGWQKLTSSCGSIANAVIALLEILYKAEVERIYITNEKLQSAGDASLSFPVSQIESQQQAFADKASDSATYASHLSQFLQQRAQGEELASHRDELQKAASILAQRAQEIVNQANECMDEPDDSSRQDKFHSLNKDVMNKGNEIIMRIKEIENERNRARIPSAATSSPPVVEVKTAPQKVKDEPKPVVSVKQAPTRAVEQPKPTIVEKPKPVTAAKQQPRNTPSRSQPTGKISNLGQVVDMAKDFAKENENKAITGGAVELHQEIEKLAEAARTGNGAQLLTSARRVAEITAKFSKDVRAASNSTSNQKAKENLFSDSKYLNDLCTQLKILASVKASLCSEGKTQMDKDEQLVYLTNNLVNMWRQTGDHLQVADLLH